MSTKNKKAPVSIGTTVREPKKQTVSKDDIIEAVLDHLEAYHSTAEVILQDYVADPGMCTELAAADDTFRSAIENIELEEESFSYLVDKIKDLPEKEVDLEELLDIVYNIDQEAIREYLGKNHKGAVVIHIPVQTQDQQAKLEEFVKTHIYPNYNDQVANLDF